MHEPNFEPETALILHQSIFHSGIADRLVSQAGAIKEYENLRVALSAIDAPKSERVVAEFLDLFKPIAHEGFERIDEEIAEHEDRVEELMKRYLEADEDVPALIHQLYDDLSNE